MYKDDFLEDRLLERKQQNAFRTLRLQDGKVDFCSNDYLGLATKGRKNKEEGLLANGSAGSRLLAGNYSLIEDTEKQIALFHDAEACLIFNSGYDANLGLLSCVPQKGDTIIYDFLSHASIRDGIRLSTAQSYAFLHNDLADLEKHFRSTLVKKCIEDYPNRIPVIISYDSNLIFLDNKTKEAQTHQSKIK